MDLLQVTAMSFLQSGQRYSPYTLPYESYSASIGAAVGGVAGNLSSYPEVQNNMSPSSSTQSQVAAASLLMSSLAQHQSGGFPLRAFYGLGGGMCGTGVGGPGDASPVPGPASSSAPQAAAPSQTATTSATPLAGGYGSYSGAYSGFSSSAPFGLAGGFCSSDGAAAQIGFGSSNIGGVGTAGGGSFAAPSAAPTFGSGSFTTGAGSGPTCAANNLYGLAGFGVGGLSSGLSSGLTGRFSDFLEKNNPLPKPQFAGSMGAFGVGGPSGIFGSTGLLAPACHNDTNPLLSVYQHQQQCHCMRYIPKHFETSVNYENCVSVKIVSCDLK